MTCDVVISLGIVNAFLVSDRLYPKFHEDETGCVGGQYFVQCSGGKSKAQTRAVA
jgi:hypothetical protein